MNIQRSVALAALGLLLAACGGEPDAAPPATEEAGMQQMEGMQGMGGMEGMASGGTTERMREHMRAMQGAGADSVMAMMPMHRQMTANMIAQMNREMRDMNMAADAEWSATVDALRQDLTRMPEMTAAELRALMPEHRARVERLMEMHGGMMEEM